MRPLILNTNLKVAFGHLLSRPKQVLVAVLSVAFGISMYVFMNGFMEGVNATQSEMAFSTLAHIRVYNDLPEIQETILEKVYSSNTSVKVSNQRPKNYSEGIKYAAHLGNKVRRIKEVTGVAPQVNLAVFFQNGSLKINGNLSGVEVVKEDQLFGISQSMVEGDWFQLKHRGEGIILGTGLANKLGVGVGNPIEVRTNEGLSRTFKVIGLVETTISNIDNKKGFIRITSARQLLSKNRDYVTDLQVNVEDFNQVANARDRLKKQTKFKVETWKESNGQLVAGNELRDIIAISVSLTILLVAGFGIYNIMNMTVNEKVREIAILKAMGFEGYDIIQIFLTQSMIIGVIGGIFGMLLGFALSLGIDAVPFEVAGLNSLPMAYRPIDYFMALFFGLITTFVAGYLPAKKAALVDPIEIIRG